MSPRQARAQIDLSPEQGLAHSRPSLSAREARTKGTPTPTRSPPWVSGRLYNFQGRVRAPPRGQDVKRLLAAPARLEGRGVSGLLSPKIPTPGTPSLSLWVTSWHRITRTLPPPSVWLASIRSLTQRAICKGGPGAGVDDFITRAPRDRRPSGPPQAAEPSAITPSIQAT